MLINVNFNYITHNNIAINVTANATKVTAAGWFRGFIAYSHYRSAGLICRGRCLELVTRSSGTSKRYKILIDCCEVRRTRWGGKYTSRLHGRHNTSCLFNNDNLRFRKTNRGWRLMTSRLREKLNHRVASEELYSEDKTIPKHLLSECIESLQMNWITFTYKKKVNHDTSQSQLV